MKNRCIIIRNKNTTNFICYSENESIVVKKEGFTVYILSLLGEDMYKVASFFVHEDKLCEEFYLRLCEYIRAGTIYVYKEFDNKHFVDTFDVDEQIKDIREHLNK